MKKRISSFLVLLFCLFFASGNGFYAKAAEAEKGTDVQEAVSAIGIPYKSVTVTEIENDILNPVMPKGDMFTNEEKNELYRIPDRPHYLLGLQQFPEPVYERRIELQKLYQMREMFYSYNGGLYIDKAAEWLGLNKNSNYLQLTSEIEVSGKRVFVIYPLHLLSDTKEKLFIYISPTGPKNLAEYSPLYEKYKVQWALGKISNEKWVAAQRILGWAQFRALKDHLFKRFHDSLTWDMNVHKDLVNGVIENQTKLLNDPDYAKKQNEPISDLKGFTVRDIMRIPKVGANEFTPNIFIFGPLKEAWGLTHSWRTPGSESIVWLDILGDAYDYIRAQSLILAHEFTHGNPYLQGTPIDFYFDVEMWTALSTDIFDDMMYFTHPYLAVVADTAHTYFGYNAREAYNRIWPSGFTNLRDFRREEYEENMKRVKEINQAFKDFIPKFMQIFYADQHFWNSVNLKWCDTAAVWRIVMAFEFEPSVIFDSKKIDPVTGKPIPPSVQTKQWLSEQEAAGKIQRLAEKAMEKTGELTDMGEKMSKIEDFAGLVKCPSNSGWFDMPSKQQKYVREMIERLLKENDPRFLNFLGHWNRIQK